MQGLVASILVLAMVSGPARAGAEIRFVAPELYADADGFGATSRAAVIDALGAEFRRLGARLPAGLDLTIEVLDIDLAGETEPWRRFSSDVRIVRDTTPPRIRLRYALRERGRIVASGEERLSDPSFLWRPVSSLNSDPLRYEKALIGDWFERRFLRRAEPQPTARGAARGDFARVR